MTAFPRTIKSRLSTPPEFPDGFGQWGHSGKGQFRSYDNVGRVWQEIYASIDTHTTDGRALLRAINQSKREKTIWTIQHPHWKTNYGAGGGSPEIDGADQTGNTLDIDGASNNITNWVRDGDIIQVAGISLVLDVVANANTNGSGEVTVTIHPPIFAGDSPTNGVAVEIDPASIWFSAVLVNVQMPDIEADGVMMPGLTLTWREQPDA